jgi:glycosyltransferase involved in cell wall biosynthesis
MTRRILFVDEDQERNGTTVSLEYLVQGFKSAGFEVGVLTWKQEEWTKAALRSSAVLLDGRRGPVATVTMSFHFSYIVSPLSLTGAKNILKDAVKFIAGFFIVRRAIREFKPGLVYLNEYTVVQASLAARTCRVPAVVHIRSRMLSGLFGLRRALMRRWVLKWNDAIFPITQSEAQQFRPGPADRRKITVVGEFFPVTERRQAGTDELRRRLGLPLDRQLVTMIGGILDIKGTREFLLAGAQILRRHPEAYLVLAGGARIGDMAGRREYYEMCAGLIKDLEQSGGLRYMGEITNALDLLAASDLLVSPSLESHFSRPVIEAWGFGKPVVAFRSQHMENLIAHELDGILVERGNVEALADAVVRLLEDPALRDSLGEAGRKKTESEFNAGVNLGKIIARCSALAGEAKSWSDDAHRD